MTHQSNNQAYDEEAVYEQASEWFLCLRDSSDNQASLEKLGDWLDADPRHEDAFERVQSAWAVMGDQAASPEMVVARRDALDRARKAASSRWGRGRVRGYVITGIAAALIAVVAIPAYQWFAPGRTQGGVLYATEVGETRVLTLADKSKISLDADSSLTVSYTDEGRTIRLEKGQAFFDVAGGVGRPFRVYAAGKQVLALGTAFNVELISGWMSVTLVEGRVAVSTDNAAAGVQSRYELAPGEQLVMKPEGQPELLKNVDMVKATSWRQGKLLFADDPLSEAIQQMNRYSHVKLQVADAEAAGIMVSGVFNAGDTTAFVEALETYFPVQAVRENTRVIKLQSKIGDK